MAAIIIILASVLATVLHMVPNHARDLNTEIQFGTTVLNSLSLIWLCIVLARYERQSHEKFGEVLRREMPTLLLALFTSLTYSIITLINMLFPA